jgi:hypothetical protein
VEVYFAQRDHRDAERCRALQRRSEPHVETLVTQSQNLASLRFAERAGWGCFQCKTETLVAINFHYIDPPSILASV